MIYGSIEDDRLKHPPVNAIEWIGYDKAKFNAIYYKCKAKTWFEARQQIAIIAKPVSLNTLIVEEVK